METVFRAAPGVQTRFVHLHPVDEAGALLDYWAAYGAIRGIYINPRRQPDGYNTLVMISGLPGPLRVSESPGAIMYAVDSCERGLLRNDGR